MKTAVYVHRRQNIKAQKVPAHVLQGACAEGAIASHGSTRILSLTEAESASNSDSARSPSLLTLVHTQSRRLATMVDWAVLAAPVLLPVSFLWDSFCFFRLWINYWLAQPEKQHSAKVFAVQAQVTSCLLPPEPL